MKTQFTIFLLLIFAIPSFGQTSKNANVSPCLIINPLSPKKIKLLEFVEFISQNNVGICSCNRYMCWHESNNSPVSIRSCRGRSYYDNYTLKTGVQIVISGTEASQYSSCASAYSISIPRNGNKEVKKHYTALKERYSNRYPNSNNQKTPELQTTLQEIRF